MPRTNGYYYVKFIGSDTWQQARWCNTDAGGVWDITAIGGEHFQYAGATPDIFAEIGDPVT